MVNNEILKATQYLQKLPRIETIEESEKYNEEVFLLPRNINFKVLKNSLIKTFGLNDNLDKKIRDLISVISIEDALNIKYKQSNILTPLMYAENLPDILWHLNTQGILFTRVSANTIEWIKEAINCYSYDKHSMDKLWLPCSKHINEVKEGDIICIFNRRVGGWDGSLERPVIELLGAGGHMPMIWDENGEKFYPLSVKENLIKELNEELGIIVDEKSILIFGGYKNDVTHELVILSGIEISDVFLPRIQEYAIQNIDEDTKGIYLGTFKEVIDYYHYNPHPFAGGAKTAPCNFPNEVELMNRIFDVLY